MRQRAALTARRIFLIMILVAVAYIVWVAQRSSQAGSGPGLLQPVSAARTDAEVNGSGSSLGTAAMTPAPFVRTV